MSDIERLRGLVNQLANSTNGNESRAIEAHRVINRLHEALTPEELRAELARSYGPSEIGLPDGLSRDSAYIQGMADTEGRLAKVLDAHIPSLSDEDEDIINDRIGRGVEDTAYFARRSCACGVIVDGFYEYIEHLKVELFGEPV